MSGIYFALGANLGDRVANIHEALRRLAEAVTIEAVSPLYESTPQPPAPGPDYLNAACRISTTLRPLPLLYLVKGIEVQMGRQTSARWAPRLIDIDIALFNDEVIELEGLTIPHAMLDKRNFVLQPLLDLDPALIHPATGHRLDDVLRGVGLAGLHRIHE